MTQNSTFDGWRFKEFFKDSGVSATGGDFFVVKSRLNR